MTPRRSPTKRRIALVVGLVALVVVGVAAAQGWRVLSAIVEAERAAVVPWPTREPSLAFSDAPTATATATGTAASLPTVTGAATDDPGSRSAPEPTVEAEPTVPAEPTATREPLLAQVADDASRVDVLRDVVGASVDGGDPGQSEVWEGKSGLNLLVVGVDRRPDGGDQNADVIIIAHVDLLTKQVAAVSLPRDLLIEIPGIGPDKINSAYNWGVENNDDDPAAGVAMVRDTVESAFGVPLDGYVLIDFDGFTEVVDAMDGVDVDVPYDIVDDQFPTEDYGTEVVSFEEGRQHMDGETALKYVRTRHADSDDARRERQFQVLLALFDKGKDLRSITRADNIILALGKTVQTSFGLEQQLTLARVGFEVERADIRLSTLGQPILQEGYTEDGRWVYVGDMPTIVTFIQDALVTEPGGDQSDGQSAAGRP